MVGEEPIHLLSRQLTWPAFILAIANGGFLYFLPGLAEAWYAWPIRPPVNAAALGAGYLVGVFATWMAIFAARDWRSIRIFVPGFFMLGVVFTAVTVIHADRFRWGYPPTWLWTIVYLAIPFGAALVWRLQERGRVAQADRTVPFPFVAWVSVAVGALLASFAVLWFLFPAWINSYWPWTLTPLLGRALATWHGFVALLLIQSGVTMRRANEVPIVHFTLAIWSLLMLLLLPLYRGSFVLGPSLLVWAVFHVFLALFSGAAALRAWASMKRAGIGF